MLGVAKNRSSSCTFDEKSYRALRQTSCADVHLIVLLSQDLMAVYQTPDIERELLQPCGERCLTVPSGLEMPLSSARSSSGRTMLRMAYATEPGDRVASTTRK